MTPLGRTLPKGARFMQVGDLFDLPAHEVDELVLWTGGTGDARWSSGWMPLARLLQRPYPQRESHLSSCPSSMVVVVAPNSSPNPRSSP